MLLLVSFVGCLLVFTLIGVLSVRKKSNTTEDYLVAGRSVSPWLTALSTVATNNSGYMFIGLIGFTYRDGLHTIWLSLAWIVGDYVAWRLVYRKVRTYSEEMGAKSVPSLLNPGNERSGRWIPVMAGAVTFLFLGAYAAAQLKAGSTALHSLLGWDMWLGAVIGAVIVVAYCFSGGLRASIWTDAAQSFVMIGSMALLLVLAIVEAGGPALVMDKLAAIDPALTNLMPPDLTFGFPLYFLGFVFGGLGVIGQPHVLIRMMAIDTPEDITRARRYYFLWFIPFTIMAIGVGLYARVLLPDLGSLTPEAAAGLSAEEIRQAVVQATESALPRLSMELMPPILIGVMLAGVFAATMSTADSQILSCSAAVTQDMFPRLRKSYLASKLATLSVAVLALVLALTAGEGVFALVLLSMSALAASIGPVLVVRLFGGRLDSPTAAAMMVIGIATVLGWHYSGWDGALFKLLPGMAAAGLTYGVATLVRRFVSEVDAVATSEEAEVPD